MIDKARFDNLVNIYNYYKTNKGPWSRVEAKTPLRFGQLFCNRCFTDGQVPPQDLFKMVDDEKAKAIILSKYVEGF